MTELIAIKNDNGKQTVSARELHEKLGIETRFNDWFKRMCEYGFEEKVDFVAITQKRVTAQGNETTFTDYAITLDMAKEICMIQRTEIGKKFRQYFIEAEKQFRNIVEGKQQVEGVSDLQFRIAVYDRLHALANEYEGKSKTYKQILDAHATKELTGEFLLPLPSPTKKTYSATEIGEKLGISANKVGIIANKYKLKTEEFGEWQRTKSKYSAKELDTFVYYDSVIEKLKELV